MCRSAARACAREGEETRAMIREGGLEGGGRRTVLWQCESAGLRMPSSAACEGEPAASEQAMRRREWSSLRQRLGAPAAEVIVMGLSHRRVARLTRSSRTMLTPVTRLPSRAPPSPFWSSFSRVCTLSFRQFLVFSLLLCSSASYILHITRGRLDPPQLVAMFRTVAGADASISLPL